MTDKKNDSGEVHNFVREIIDADLAAGKYERTVTRFPPEPNGYLHIGHTKSICLNFGIARDYRGQCHLRFDDTNPETEDIKFIHSIQEDIRWLGFDWDVHLYYASDYFEKMYGYAQHLIREGKAYVCSLNADEIREYRGSLSEPGRPSPDRERPVHDSLDLFARMRAGEFKDGEYTVRAKIDMAASNMKMRDPLLYRIRHAHHPRTGDEWCIYPMYDYAHCLSDSIESITHSICTLEFENNRELYDWVLEYAPVEHISHQYEFAKLALTYTMLSKRNLKRMVEDGLVDGWDDPRMQTVAGMRRRGYTPESLQAFCESVGVTKANTIIDITRFDYYIRDDLNQRCPRVMAVLEPLKVVITNYPQADDEIIDAAYWPRNFERNETRPLPFGRELYIERSDFQENPEKGFYRMRPGGEVRLRHAYFMRCDEVIKNADGEVVELRCSYDPDTRGGTAPDGRKVKGTIHWVSASQAVDADVRLYERLYTAEFPGRRTGNFLDDLNPESVRTLTGCKVEPSVLNDDAATRYQFERNGYFWQDSRESSPNGLVFNRIISLRDSWQKAKDAPAKPAAETITVRNKKADTRPAKRTAAQIRAATRRDNPELAVRMTRYMTDYSIPEDSADLLTADLDLADTFEQAVSAYPEPKTVAKWFVNVLLGELKERSLTETKVDGTQLGHLIRFVTDGDISSTSGKKVLVELLNHGGEANTHIESLGLRQVSDTDALGQAIDEVLAANSDKVDAYKGGRTALFGFFVGQAMKATGGRANPKVIQHILREKLDS